VEAEKLGYGSATNSSIIVVKEDSVEAILMVLFNEVVSLRCWVFGSLRVKSKNLSGKVLLKEALVFREYGRSSLKTLLSKRPIRSFHFLPRCSGLVEHNQRTRGSGSFREAEFYYLFDVPSL
jgi:hypothetical protein